MIYHTMFNGTHLYTPLGQHQLYPSFKSEAFVRHWRVIHAHALAIQRSDYSQTPSFRINTEPLDHARSKYASL